jgi:hypothetical protein
MPGFVLFAGNSPHSSPKTRDYSFGDSPGLEISTAVQVAVDEAGLSTAGLFEQPAAPGAELEPAPVPEPAAPAEAESELQVEAQAQAEVEPQVEAEVEAQAEPEPEPEPEPISS